MLGFEKNKTKIIKEPFATEIRTKLARFRNNDFTKEELELFDRNEKLNSKYNAKWKD